MYDLNSLDRWLHVKYFSTRESRVGIDYCTSHPIYREINTRERPGTHRNSNHSKGQSDPIGKAYLHSLEDNHDLINQLIANKLKQVSRKNQRAFLSLHNNFRGSLGPFLGIVKTNALPLGPDAIEGGLFLQASRINHACLPNC